MSKKRKTRKEKAHKKYHFEYLDRSEESDSSPAQKIPHDIQKSSTVMKPAEQKSPVVEKRDIAKSVLLSMFFVVLVALLYWYNMQNPFIENYATQLLDLILQR